MCCSVLDGNYSKVQLPVEREEKKKMGRQDYFRDLKPRPHLPVPFSDRTLSPLLSKLLNIVQLVKPSHKDITLQFLALMEASGTQTAL
ncbi:hypothetical protein INR49_017243 [Caranx melampygus]|nr:hypothetical protein INR49_017243 [Caranx melampygus]